MKILFKFFIAIVLLFGTFSCTDFLQTQPQDFSTVNNYYKKADELRSGVIGIYQNLNRVFTDDYLYYISGATDECYLNYTPLVNDIRTFSHTSTNSSITTSWNNIYAGIFRANTIINACKTKPLDMDTLEFRHCKAEARFLRGYYYYLLVANWGDVPLVLELPTDPAVVRKTRTDKALVYAQILDDMKYAADSALKTSDLSAPSTDRKTGGGGRISQCAVWGCLARVCLQMAGQPLNDQSKYVEAKYWAQKVVDYYMTNKLSLCPDYTQVFKDLMADLYDRNEVLWEVEFGSDGVMNKYGTVGVNFGISSSSTVAGNGYGYFSTNRKMTPGSGLYEATDVRQAWNNADYYYSNPATTDTIKVTKRKNWLDNYPGKFNRKYETALPKTSYWGPGNYPVLRYADVLLMLAEAENEINGPTTLAHDKLNEVRKRANATQYNAASGAFAIQTDKVAFRKIIQDERLRELCFEATRRLDLIRWGIYVSSIQAAIAENEKFLTTVKPAVSSLKNIQPKHVLLPIPLSELNLNNAMIQNPGF